MVDTLILTGPNFEQINAGSVVVIPTGGSAQALKDVLRGISGNGTIIAAATINASSTLEIGGTPITATAGELNVLHSVVAGTARASSALVLGASKNVDVLQVAALTTTGIVAKSVTNTITATGSNQATGVALTSEYNRVTVGTLNTGVVLPAAAVGERVVVFNDGSAAIKVYGNGTDTIDGTAGSTGVTLTNTKRCDFVCFAAGAWLSAQEGAVSA